MVNGFGKNTRTVAILHIPVLFNSFFDMFSTLIKFAAY